MAIICQHCVHNLYCSHQEAKKNHFFYLERNKSGASTLQLCPNVSGAIVCLVCLNALAAIKINPWLNPRLMMSTVYHPKGPVFADQASPYKCIMKIKRPDLLFKSKSEDEADCKLLQAILKCCNYGLFLSNCFFFSFTVCCYAIWKYSMSSSPWATEWSFT